MNQFKSFKSLAAASLVLVFLAACGSSGGLGDILGGGGGSSTPASSRYEIRGTVDSVDSSNRSVYLTNVSGYTSNLSNSGSTARVYFDDQTTVEYQGKTYRPEDLERGDQISVRVDESGNRLVAESMTVVYDVSSGGSAPSGSYSSTVQGKVTYVDSSRRTIEVDRGYGSRTIVEYDLDTRVHLNGRTYRPSDLERGDEIDIRVSDVGGGRLIAQDITVTRSMSSGTSGGSQTPSSTVRGTVGYVDTARRTIELESARWISSFDTRPSGSSTMVIQYDTNTRVEVEGGLHPVANLERGDIVDVYLQQDSGSTKIATRLVLVRDVNQTR